MPDPKPGNGLAPASKEERVQLCMKLMRQGRWRPGQTDKNIAAYWNLNIDAVQQYSAEAWRRVKSEVTDPDATAATICVALRNVVEEAKTKGLAGHRSVIEAGKAWAQISGAGAPSRIELGALASMSDEELDRRRKDIMARLAEAQEKETKETT